MVLQASVAEWTAELYAIKVGDIKKILPLGPLYSTCMGSGIESRTNESSSKFNGVQFLQCVKPQRLALSLKKDPMFLKNILPSYK